ncbi:MAG: hypothetical protein U9Q07_14745, partial [Planctomycetota bacterium]|nr:hypothetical protein [Planctomycetota bacterium]
MGGRLSGRNMWAAIGIQSAKGTAGRVGEFFEINDVGGCLEEYSTIESNRRINNRFKGSGYLGSKSVPWSLTLEANTKNIGYLLYAALGSETGTELSTPTRYQHSFTDTDELPYVTIVVYTAGVADDSGTDKFHVIQDAKIGEFGISGGTDDVTLVSLSGVGMSRSAVATTLAGSVGGVGNDEVTVASTAGLIKGMAVVTDTGVTTTISSITDGTDFVLADAAVGATGFTFSPTFQTGKPLFFNSDEGTGILKIGASLGAAAQFDESTHFELNWNNGLSADHRIHGSSTAFGMEEGDSVMEGSATVIFNADSFAEIDAYQAGTDRALWAVWTSKNLISGSTYESLDIKITKSRYTGTPPSWDPDVITAELHLHAVRTGCQVFNIPVRVPRLCLRIIAEQMQNILV